MKFQLYFPTTLISKIALLAEKSLNLINTYSFFFIQVNMKKGKPWEYRSFKN